VLVKSGGTPRKKKKKKKNSVDGRIHMDRQTIRGAEAGARQA
jgi:hypothetical protein